MKTVEGLSYRQWQQRNSTQFKQLSKAQQKKVRSLGYRNVGWQNVQSSWPILEAYLKTLASSADSSAPSSFFDRKLKKGDVIGALEHSILEAEQAQKLAEEAIASIESQHQNVTDIANKALEKYRVL